MAAITQWLGQLATGYRVRAERRPLPGLTAFHWNGPIAEADRIHNISASGVYLDTRAHWTQNAMVSLTLRPDAQLLGQNDQSVSLMAKVVRRDRRGVALSFLLPKDLDLTLWANPLQAPHRKVEAADIVREFRLAKALAFIDAISPSTSTRVRRLMRGELSTYRILGAVEIALRAEAMMFQRSEQAKPTADPAAVLRILIDGSWADDDRRLNMWAGLLSVAPASAGCYPLRDLIHAMSQLASSHAQLLITACKRTHKIGLEDGVISALPLVCTTEEMVALAETHDLHRIDRELDHMADLGLFIRREKSRFFVAIDDTTMTPSRLGLELYARGCGHHGSLSDFYGVTFSDFSILGAMN
ncbi:MAG TPA: PilZ domain-containing protein [Terracidiphilus sp.]